MSKNSDSGGLKGWVDDHPMMVGVAIGIVIASLVFIIINMMKGGKSGKKDKKKKKEVKEDYSNDSHEEDEE